MFELKDKRCYYCGVTLTDENISIDHKTPLCMGGDNTYDNLCLCCKKCNEEKDDLTEEEYRQYLIDKTGNRLENKEIQFDTPFLIEIAKIRIPPIFQQTNIREKKVNKAKSLYAGDGVFDKPISLKATNRLVDGYSRYIAAKDIGLNFVQVQYVHNY